MAQIKRNFRNEPELYSLASATTGLKRTHFQRKRYRDQIVGLIGPSRPFNFWGEDYFLGRVNHVGNACVVDEASLKQLRYADSSEALFAVNFVADAWRDLVEEIDSLVEDGVLHADSPYANLRAKKAFVSAPSAYHSYMIETVYPLFEAYLRVFQTEEKGIVNLPSFLLKFTRYANLYVNNTGPMTFSSFVESGYCSPLTSGLVISTSEDDHNADFAKTDKYFFDNNFEAVQSIATQYGFGIDQNAPWRFVADLSSPAMKEYMVGVEIEDYPTVLNDQDNCDVPFDTGSPGGDPFGYSALPGYEDVLRHASGYLQYADLAEESNLEVIFGSVFQNAYRECWRVDMDFLKIYLFGFYNTFARVRPFVNVLTEVELESCFTAITVRLNRLTVDPDFASQNGNFGDKWNLKTYYLLKRLEKKMDHSIAKIRKNLRDVIQTYDFAPGNSDAKYALALQYLQEKIIGPTDARALTIDSVGDIKNR